MEVAWVQEEKKDWRVTNLFHNAATCCVPQNLQALVTSVRTWYKENTVTFDLLMTLIKRRLTSLFQEVVCVWTGSLRCWDVVFEDAASRRTGSPQTAEDQDELLTHTAWGCFSVIGQTALNVLLSNR